MPKKQSKSSFLSVRVTPKERTDFGKKAEAYGGTSAVMRELVEAFMQDRLTIKPNPEKRSLYHVS